MTDAAPPETYDEFLRLVHARRGGMSRTYLRISEFLTENPNDVAVQPVNATAQQCGIHASSFVRFAQSLGYTGFRDLQALFQRRLSSAVPGFEARKRALEGELALPDDRSELGLLRDLVVRDITALQDLVEWVDGADMARAADLIEAAGTVYLVGQLRSEPVVSLLRYALTMLGKRCVLLDASGGLATHMARTMASGDVLVAVSFRFYAAETVAITTEAARAGAAVVAISDSAMSPLAGAARVHFEVPEHEHIFSRSLAAPLCLAQALTMAVAARVQHDEAPRIPTVTSR